MTQYRPIYTGTFNTTTTASTFFEGSYSGAYSENYVINYTYANEYATATPIQVPSTTSNVALMQKRREKFAQTICGLQLYFDFAHNLNDLNQAIFHSENLYVAEIADTIATTDGFRRTAPFISGLDFNSAVQQMVRELNQLMMRSIFQAATLGYGSLYDGSVINQLMETNPDWMVVSKGVARSFKQDLSGADLYGLQSIGSVLNRNNNLPIKIYCSDTPQCEQEFIVSGIRPSILFRYNAPFTVLYGGHLVTGTNFRASKTGLRGFISQEVQKCP